MRMLTAYICDECGDDEGPCMLLVSTNMEELPYSFCPFDGSRAKWHALKTGNIELYKVVFFLQFLERVARLLDREDVPERNGVVP